MSRDKSLPTLDFLGSVTEIWHALDRCLYHFAYLKIYADTAAMKAVGSKRRREIALGLSETQRDEFQQDVTIFRAHFAGVFWQLNHLANELLAGTYRRCKEDGVVTKEQFDAFLKALDEDSVLKEILAYRNMSHEYAGVIATLHDSVTDEFIAHVIPPLDVKNPESRKEVALDGPEIQERELNTKLKAYCDHVAGFCERLFKMIEAKYGKIMLSRSRKFLVTIPHSYQGQLPEGAKGVLYMQANSTITP
jgi:hypothetical protein